MASVIQTNIRNYLPLVASGKVREIYSLDESKLLFVATDRISAYDVVMKNAIDQKGAILTQLSEFWFTLLQSMIPELHTHYISMGVPAAAEDLLPPHMATKLQLQQRSMVVKCVKVFPIESIVRGYITGSAWTSYQKGGTVCGTQLPIGLQESEKLQQPLWTPSTKAELGGKDENISPAQAADIVGKQYADQIEALSLEIYRTANDYAAKRGIIIADTKFEFGLDESTTPPTVVLVDEVLTPDSSRFWSADKYEVGRGQDSYDKQYLRGMISIEPIELQPAQISLTLPTDWLVRSGLKGKEAVEVPSDIVSNTFNRYQEAYQTLTGKRWFAAA